MDKLTMAHDYALVRITCSNPKTLDEIISLSWYYAAAMQAEADKRNNKERPDVLCEVDWSQAPRGTAAYMKLSDWDIGVWIDDLGFQINDAPTFGFTGSHIVERPQ